MEVINDMALLRQHGSNQEVITQVPPEMADELEAGMRVAVNNNFVIVNLLAKPPDLRARVMELIEAPNVDYSSIGGLDQQI